MHVRAIGHATSGHVVTTDTRKRWVFSASKNAWSPMITDGAPQRDMEWALGEVVVSRGQPDSFFKPMHNRWRKLRYDINGKVYAREGNGITLDWAKGFDPNTLRVISGTTGEIWTPRKGPVPAPRWDGYLLTMDALWVWSGHKTQPRGNRPPFVAGGSVLGLNSKKWQAIATKEAPAPRSNALMAGDGNDLFLLGGHDGNKRLQDAHAYSRKTRRWRTISTVGAPQYASAQSPNLAGARFLAIIDRRPPVARATPGPSPRGPATLALYDRKKNKWYAHKLPTTGSALMARTSKGRLVIYESSLKWAYLLDAKRPRLTPLATSGLALAPRSNPASGVRAGTLYVLGGVAKSYPGGGCENSGPRACDPIGPSYQLHRDGAVCRW
jgi:hypothetical protein